MVSLTIIHILFTYNTVTYYIFHCLNLPKNASYVQPIQLDNFSIPTKSTYLTNIESKVHLAGLPKLPRMSIQCATLIDPSYYEIQEKQQYTAEEKGADHQYITMLDQMQYIPYNTIADNTVQQTKQIIIKKGTTETSWTMAKTIKKPTKHRRRNNNHTIRKNSS